ncbi:hypothetical protein M426DRAFT_23241 [Hypoxylon sp. CI-4A]|nr:hypothetical protein M426DRAFT_23241 [Hypoxylon sp. CI-4A]
MEFMNQMTDNPDWDKMVFDESIVAKWKKTATSYPLKFLPRDDVFMSNKMFRMCLNELREKAEHFKKTGYVTVLDAELAVAKSDTVIPPSLLEALKEDAKALEDVPDEKKLWHPSSGKKVLNLIDPTMFPLVYGTTRVLPHGKVPLNECTSFIGKGETAVLCEDVFGPWLY